jgi:hypothetical protein
VRAVATQTLREARNREEFLLRARTILGFGIDVIPGREEARLIYQGVAHMLPHNDASDRERRLVIDIGGRSTEMIIGRALEAQLMESYRVGSVAWSMKHFAEGQFTPAAFRAAEVAAKAVLDDALGSYTRDQWDVAYGASGTIGAVGDVLAAAGAGPGVVTREGLDWLLDRLLKAGSVDKLRIDGMREDRKAVIGGGVSVLRAVFDLLGIDEMKVAQGALRHGVMYELLERDDSVADMRTATVARLATRFAVDPAQAARVGDTAAALFVQVAPTARGGSTVQPRRPGPAQARLGRAAARDRRAGLAQRLPQAWRLHPRQHRRTRLRGERAACAGPIGAGPARQAAQARSGAGRRNLRDAAARAAAGRDPVPRASRPGSAGTAPGSAGRTGVHDCLRARLGGCIPPIRAPAARRSAGLAKNQQLARGAQRLLKRNG